MKQGKAIIARAARIRAAVTAAVAGKGCPCPGARIEEILGEEIARYPDQIMSLDVLPGRDDFEFVGYDADFSEIVCLQLEYAPGKFAIDSGGYVLVGWKPLRMGDTALTGRIDKMNARLDLYSKFDAGFKDDKKAYEESDAYRGVKFCTGKHAGEACKDPFCIRRR